MEIKMLPSSARACSRPHSGANEYAEGAVSRIIKIELVACLRITLALALPRRYGKHFTVDN